MKFTTIAGAWLVVLTLGGGWLFVSNVPIAASTNAGARVSDFSLKYDAEIAVRTRLRDPDSAQFKDISVIGPIGPDHNRAVCGNVNGRNGFGGYTGFTPFIYYSYGDVWISSANPRSEGQFSAEFITTVCKELMTKAAKEANAK